MKYIDCKKYATEILDQVKEVPNKKKLAIITVGDDPASLSYVKGKIKDCEYCGMPYEHIQMTKEQAEQGYLADCIVGFNYASNVGGIIVQLPLPDGLNEEYYTHLVKGYKDVDGFREDSKFLPCTPEGIMYILEKELGDLTGMNVLVVGRGKLVGEPIAKMLLDANCTVTVAHSKTKNLDYIVPNYDIIISAVGKPNLVNLEMCNAKVVIDVGVSRDENGKLCGDCYNFRTDYCHNTKVTPVPGGIGLMTRAMLMKHVSET